MSVQTAVINATGDHEETVERYAKHLGKDKIRRKLFKRFMVASEFHVLSPKLWRMRRSAL